MKIELHKAFRVPIDGLMPIAEEIIIQKEKKIEDSKIGPYQVAATKNKVVAVTDKKAADKEDSEEDGEAPALAPATDTDEKAIRKQLAKD